MYSLIQRLASRQREHWHTTRAELAHTWLPFVGWLPHEATVKVVAPSDRWWVKHCGGVAYRHG
ncbi:MAG TPA: hypothetical protein VLT45_10990 [Kofleriaceae bacterium]|nr:hypothetical protein [Kofleriaceae bacterium]